VLLLPLLSFLAIAAVGAADTNADVDAALLAVLSWGGWVDSSGARHSRGVEEQLCAPFL
jgi:hypothetical protein